VWLRLVHVTLVIAVAHCGHDGADEAKRCMVDEVQADAFAWVHCHTQ
jgi:hypothetical protein